MGISPGFSAYVLPGSLHTPASGAFFALRRSKPASFLQVSFLLSKRADGKKLRKPVKVKKLAHTNTPTSKPIMKFVRGLIYYPPCATTTSQAGSLLLPSGSSLSTALCAGCSLLTAFAPVPRRGNCTRSLTECSWSDCKKLLKQYFSQHWPLGSKIVSN